MSLCRFCRAEIRWGVTQSTRRIPLDAVPNPAGNVRTTGEGPARFATASYIEVLGPLECEAARQHNEELFMPHHATSYNPPPRRSR